MSEPILWFVIPCYNEEEVLPITAPSFLDKIKQLVSEKKISDSSRVLFVNDGSSDSTWSIITSLAESDPHYIGISQSCNRGHQNAVLAGLMESIDHADVTISIDCDGQDDLNASDRMIDAYLNGAEIVYGARASRDTDTWFKRTSAQQFYRLLNRMGANTVYNSADYRLVSRRVLLSFADFHEVNLFLRGMFPLVGYKSEVVYYDRKERIAGHSHYPLKKMLGLAFNGITSLSIRPLEIIASIGVFFSVLGLIGVIYSIVRFAAGHTVTGWTSMVCIVLILGGIILLSLGVIGEYIGKTYMETKHRPRYIISDRTWAPYRRTYLEDEEDQKKQ